MTANCTNPQLGEKLYAWELGMLGGSEREELELHLMECEVCAAKAQKFAATAELLRGSSRVRKAVIDEPRPSVASSKWSSIFRISLVAAAVLVLLLLQPWQLEFHSTLEAIAADNRLAVISFENLSDGGDSARWSDIVTELLITDLSESRYLQVISSQRVHDIERDLTTDEIRSGREETAVLIAKEASARYYLTGSVIESDGLIALTSHLVDVTSGVVLASQEATAKTGENVFGLVDRLSAEIRLDLNLPERALDELDRPVSEVTTNSTEAYRHYLEGIELLEQMYRSPAKQAFERAVEADTTFAMAYYHLARLGQRDLIDRAIEYSSRASRKEQHYIMATKADFDGDWDEQANQLRQLVVGFPDEKEAWYRLGSYHNLFHRYDSAIAYLQRAIELDPVYRGAHNILTYAYSHSGDFARAIESIDRYIAAAPSEANPWDTRGDLFAVHGYPERAAESFAQALEIRPDFTPSTFKLIQMRIFMRQYSAADSLIDALERYDAFGIRVMARLYRAYLPLHRGQFADALETIETGIAQNRADATSDSVIWERAAFHKLKALIYSELDDFEAAVAQIDTCRDIFSRHYPDDTVSHRYLRAEYLAEAGRFDEADREYQVLDDHFKSTGRAPCYALWSGGAIELARGNPAGAIRFLEEVAELTTVSDDFYGHYLLARAYLAGGDLGKAVDKLRQLLDSYSPSRLQGTIDAVRLHYYLGIAYEESQWPDKAIEQLETFLSIWEDADSGLEAVSDARERLSRLKSSS